MTDPRLQIRLAEDRDLEAIVAIEQASFGDPWSAGALLQEMEPSALRLPLVADIGGEVAGYLMAWRSADQLHILNVAVATQRRRLGVASRLLAAALAAAEDDGLLEATLEVRPGNRAALALYRAFGFRQVGLRPGYYADTGEDAVILSLDLPRTDT